MGKTFFEMTPAEREQYTLMVFPADAPDTPHSPVTQMLTWASVLISCARPGTEMTAGDWKRSASEWRAAYLEYVRDRENRDRLG